MQRQLDGLAVVLLVYAAALFLGEMNLRQEASLRYVCLGLIFITFVGIDIWYMTG